MAVSRSSHSEENVRRSYQGSDTGTDVEDSPEPHEVATLARFRRVGHHDCTLASPQTASAHTKVRASEDIKAMNLRSREMNLNQDTDDIETVAGTTKENRELDTDTVDDRTSRETHDGKSTVQGDVLRTAGAEMSVICRPESKRSNGATHHLISSVGIRETTASHTVDSIEHARAHEAGEGDEAQLESGRGIPDLVFAEAEGLVHPAWGTRDGVRVRIVSGNFRAEVGALLPRLRRHGCQGEGESRGSGEEVEVEKGRKEWKSRGSKRNKKLSVKPARKERPKIKYNHEAG